MIEFTVSGLYNHNTKESTMWIDLGGFKGLPDNVYRVNDLAEIQRIRKGHGSVHGRILKHQCHPQGYLVVNLYYNCVHLSCKVHQLMAFAFLGPRPANAVVNH